MELGISLKMALAKRGMQNKKLAELLGTSEQQVSNWIKSGGIKRSSLKLICDALEMKVSDFVALGE